MTPEIKIVENVSMSVFSIARRFGGCTIDGKSFIYFADKDILLRKDLCAKYREHIKAGNTFEDFLKTSKN